MELQCTVAGTQLCVSANIHTHDRRTCVEVTAPTGLDERQAVHVPWVSLYQLPET